MVSILLASNLAFAAPVKDITTILEPGDYERPGIEFPLVDRIADIVDEADDLVHIGLIAAAFVAPGWWEGDSSAPTTGVSIDLNSRRYIEDPRTWSPPPSRPTVRFTSDLGNHDAPGILVRSSW